MKVVPCTKHTQTHTKIYHFLNVLSPLSFICFSLCAINTSDIVGVVGSRSKVKQVILTLHHVNEDDAALPQLLYGCDVGTRR